MQTSLDYIITDEVIERNVQDCEVLSDDAIDNVSDHLPIVASISIVKALPKVTVKPDNISVWHKATSDQLIAYQLDMESELRILNTVDYHTNAEIIIYQMQFLSRCSTVQQNIYHKVSIINIQNHTGMIKTNVYVLICDKRGFIG